MKARLLLSIAIGVAVVAAAFAALAPGGDETDADRAGAPREGEVGWSNEGRRTFAAMGCGSCHRLAAAGSTGRIGPSLDDELAGHDRESLTAAIVRVPGEGTSAMPDDYGQRMTDAELDALVSFLLAAAP